MKSLIFSTLALAVVATSAQAQFNFSSIQSGASVFTDGNIDTALGALNTAALDRNTGISLDSDNNTLVLLTRNGATPFGDFLLKFDVTQPVSGTNPANFGGNLDGNNGASADVRTGSGGVAISAGNGLVLYYDIQAVSGTNDEILTWNIATGANTLVLEAPLGGTEQFEHISGTNWLANESVSFGGLGRLRTFDSSTGTFSATLATATGTDGVKDIDVVQNGAQFDGYFTNSLNQIFRVTDLLGTPGVATDVTPSNLAAVASIAIQDLIAIDSNTFVVNDTGNSRITISDNNVLTNYTYAQIATATSAPNFTLLPTFIFDHIEKRVNGTGQLELYITNNAAFTGTQAGTEPSVVVIRFAAAVANVDNWNVYSY